MSMGTRMHQAAMFVVYESPIQLFSGNPSQGLMEPEFMELIGSIPTVWDETVIPDAKVGEYIVTARKKGDKWFVGGMTNWNERDIRIDLSFLDDREYNATIAIDGINANRHASDYMIRKEGVTRHSILDLHMAKGGGFVLVFTPQKK
jgi:alpha-glucosidase